LKSFLDLHPTVFHDLHESVNLLYVSTGTGPYNPNIAPIQVTEWWWLAQNEIMEMTKRGVPGVWTFDYYDGWVPNYMFWIGVMHKTQRMTQPRQRADGDGTAAAPRETSRRRWKESGTERIQIRAMSSAEVVTTKRNKKARFS